MSKFVLFYLLFKIKKTLIFSISTEIYHVLLKDLLW